MDKIIFIAIGQFVLLAITVCVIIYVAYSEGKRFYKKYLSKKYNVPKSFFWTAYIFATPIIVSPILLYVSLFMDHVKHDNMIILAQNLINTYAIWFIYGFVLSMKLYNRYCSFWAILPSAFSWILAFGAVFLGWYLVSY